MKFIRHLEIVQDFDGKFWARDREEIRWWIMPPMSRPRPTREMGPYDTDDEAQKALAYLRGGPRVVQHEAIES